MGVQLSEKSRGEKEKECLKVMYTSQDGPDQLWCQFIASSQKNGINPSHNIIDHLIPQLAI